MNKIFSSVALGWLGRRALDWGGWIGTFATFLFGIYAALPPAGQNAIGRVFQGEWQDLTLGALVPIASLVISQVMSFRSTTKDQVVANGKKVALPDLPTKTQVEVKQVTARKRDTITDLLKGIFTH